MSISPLEVIGQRKKRYSQGCRRITNLLDRMPARENIVNGRTALFLAAFVLFSNSRAFSQGTECSVTYLRSELEADAATNSSKMSGLKTCVTPCVRTSIRAYPQVRGWISQDPQQVAILKTVFAWKPLCFLLVPCVSSLRELRKWCGFLGVQDKQI